MSGLTGCARAPGRQGVGDHAARGALESAGEQWTEMRATIFETLADYDTPASAYDIAERIIVLSDLGDARTFAELMAEPKVPSSLPEPGVVELDDVVFGYHPDAPVLTGVSMKVPARTMCAIVGPSGSGKMTIARLVARFWDEPYTGPLVQWGTRLHDRYLLPAFVATDLRDVIDDVNRYLQRVGAGRIDPAWFDAFLEFRFPRLGDTTIGGVEVELRTAIEPWNVLGEEVSQFGTARYVDSSVEKVQVRAVGLVEGRHVVTCNGVPVPMVPVAEQGWGGPVGAKGSSGAFVGGVRYRAWAPPSALHPTIGVHGPLVFDLVDR